MSQLFAKDKHLKRKSEKNGGRQLTFSPFKAIKYSCYGFAFKT